MTVGPNSHKIQANSYQFYADSHEILANSVQFHADRGQFHGEPELVQLRKNNANYGQPSDPINLTINP